MQSTIHLHMMHAFLPHSSKINKKKEETFA